jgi:hypothetical protein
MVSERDISEAQTGTFEVALVPRSSIAFAAIGRWFHRVKAVMYGQGKFVSKRKKQLST